MTFPLSNYLESEASQDSNYVVRSHHGNSTHESLDFYRLDAYAFWQVFRDLFFQAQDDDFPDVFHQFIKGPTLAVATLELGDLPYEEPVFVLLDYDVELSTCHLSSNWDLCPKFWPMRCSGARWLRRFPLG